MGGLRIAIVHHHVRRGGVASVIRRAVSGLAGAGAQGVILVGEKPDEPIRMDWPIRVVEGLGYGDGTDCEPEALADGLIRTAEEALSGRPDLWHVHNHALGKNPALTAAVSRLAERGERLLLQIHDFAEDGRVSNFTALKTYFREDDFDALGRKLYPQGARVHYAVLNRRDRTFLIDAGWAESRLHLLPNSVDAIAVPSLSDRRPFYVYPTRGIRRKNLGEFLFWASVEDGAARFAVTLAPRNPRERPIYEAWKSLATELGIPVEFEAGEKPGVTFSGLLGEATAVVSTSVAEGFGLAFLEPGLAGRPVCGRDLPEITQDFREEGVELPHLYDRLDIPADWLDMDVLWRKLETGLSAQYRAYGLPFTARHLDAARRAVWREGQVDFGRLDEELQDRVIREVRAHPERAASYGAGRLMKTPADAAVLNRNQERIARVYGAERYAVNLLALYRTIAGRDEPADAAVSEAKLLERFLAPERFFHLRG